MGDMHTMLRPVFFALIGALLLPSCGFFKKKKKAVPRNSNIRLSGRVQSVNKDAKSVIIRRYGPWKVDEGQVVESRGEGRTGNLIPTGEKLGEHVAADIRSGEVEVGDAVYIRRVTKKPEDIKPAAPTTPQPPAPVPNQPQNGVSTPETPGNVPPPTPKAPGKPKNPTVPEDRL